MNYKSSLTNILPIHPQSSESTPFSSPQRHSGPRPYPPLAVAVGNGVGIYPEGSRTGKCSFIHIKRTFNIQLHIHYLLHLFHCLFSVPYVSIAMGTSSCSTLRISRQPHIRWSLESGVSGRFTRLPAIVAAHLRALPAKIFSKDYIILLSCSLDQLMPILFMLLLLISL